MVRRRVDGEHRLDMRLWVFISVISVLMLGGCVGRYYVPAQVPVNRTGKANPSFDISRDVTVVNGASPQKVALGNYLHDWSADLRQWTDATVELLKSELRRANAVDDLGKKTLALDIRNATLFWESREITSTVLLHVQTGDGYENSCEVTGASHSLYASCDNAITRAVECLLDDPEIRRYLAPRDTDSDGVYDSQDRCPQTPAGSVVDRFGCPPAPAPEPVATVEPPKPPPPPPADPHVQDVLFDFDQYRIKPAFYPVLDRLADLLKKNPSMKVEVQGHADTVGAERYNLGLSEKRAMEVCRYLAGRGISMDRLLPAGYGASKPKSDQSTPEGDALNRRVELIPLLAK